MVNTLHGLAVVVGLGPEDVRHEGLRVAVVEGEPAGLDLHHDAVAGQEDVAGVGQGEAVQQRFIGHDRLGGIEVLAISAAEDVGGDHQLVAAHGGLAGDFVGIDVNQLDDPIGVAAAGRGDEVGDGLAADLHGFGQHLRGEGHDVGAAGGFALVVDQPLGPRESVAVAHRLMGAGAIRDRLRRVGDVFLECSVAGFRGGEVELEAGVEVQRGQANLVIAGVAGGPGRQLTPGVGAGLEGGDGGHVRLAGPVLQVLGQERPQDFAAKVERGVAAEFQGAQAAAVVDHLAVMPGADDQEHLVVVRVLRFEGLINRRVP